MPPKMARTVVKVGGSLVERPARLRAVLADLAEGREGPAVIVPGGGPFADAVRLTQAQLGFDDATAHRLALDAMGQMAQVFCAIEPRLVLATSVAALDDRPCVVWTPGELRGGHPDIPESWDVTSDSLALWLAARIGAERCLLLKSADCPHGATPQELAEGGLVDRAFPRFAERFRGSIVLRGPSGRDAPVASSHSRPHPEVPAPAGLEGGLQNAQRSLEGSFEARLRLAPQDEGVGGMAGDRRLGVAP